MNARLLGPALLVLAACRSVGTASEAKPDKASGTSTAAATRRSVGTDPGKVGAGTPLEARPGNELAAFAGGCFWGVEDNFRQVPGVVATAVGYTGGKTQSPTYETVSGHGTGHAEAVLVEYDPTKITYEQLVVVFFKNHDPTTMNRQGPDVGSNYRSAVFTFNDKQAEIVTKVMAAEEKERKEKVVTIVSPIAQFWKAEEYHQQYDEKTGTHSCPLPKGLPKST
ncbi:MAG: peptide-methionine (S)-S-oxide reductase [Myxococcales bacterium]|nr:peptide-methionine (S)-S-oxide reductase [Myxococcales bacterium]